LLSSARKIDWLRGGICQAGLTMYRRVFYKDVQFKKFCMPVKSSSPSAENDKETPGYLYLWLRFMKTDKDITTIRALDMVIYEPII